MSILIPIVNRTVVEDTLPTGTYPAILQRIITIGTVMTEYRGRIKPQPKLLLSWVLPTMSVRIRETVVPAIVHKEYTQSLHESANLRRDLTAMRGMDFGPEDIGFNVDIEQLLGLTCLVTVEPQPGKDGRSVTNVTGFAPIPEDELLLESPLPFQSLNYESFDWPLLESLSRRLQQRLMETPEFTALQHQRPNRTASAVTSDES